MTKSYWQFKLSHLLCLFTTVLSFPVLSTDTRAPVLESWELSPLVVNVDTASAQVKAIFRVTDESGVKAPNVTASHRSGDTIGFADIALKSGDAYDGTWEATLTAPQGTTSGTWEVFLYPLKDNLGNAGSFGPPSSYMRSFNVATPIDNYDQEKIYEENR